METFEDTISLQPGEPIDPKDPVELRRFVSLFLSTDRVRRTLGGAAPPAGAPLVLTALPKTAGDHP